jgi:hypothetical protein
MYATLVEPAKGDAAAEEAPQQRADTRENVARTAPEFVRENSVEQACFLDRSSRPHEHDRQVAAIRGAADWGEPSDGLAPSGSRGVARRGEHGGVDSAGTKTLDELAFVRSNASSTSGQRSEPRMASVLVTRTRSTRRMSRRDLRS